MKVKEILGEAIVTQHLLYDPNNDAGPYNMTNINGPFDMTTDPPSGEQEEESDEGLAFTTCSRCEGTGEGQYPGSHCRKCKGTGVIDHRDETGAQ